MRMEELEQARTITIVHARIVYVVTHMQYICQEVSVNAQKMMIA